MSITVQLDLPEGVAEKALAAGLLDPVRVATMIQRELDFEANPRSFFETIREIRSQPGEPMSMEELQAEVDAFRSEKNEHEARP